ncbi:hypothetical protein [Henriciella sp.]|uniref:hypothetical protein n=1 Tax=Henriciella sp. TaxID=1968823 RepID=UPI00263728CD|nr:hypothetical protein [Henriciella sp.]
MPKLFSSLALAPVMGITLVALSGCIVIDAEEGVLHENWDGAHTYGPLKGADVSAQTVTIRVTSNGCTTKDFIGADVRKTGSDRFSVGFYREKEDYCRANLPDGVALTWDFAELGIPEGADVSVRNSVRN